MKAFAYYGIVAALLFGWRAESPQAAALPHGVPHLCASDPAATVVAAGATYTLQGAETCVRVEGTLVIPARPSVVTTILAYPASTVNCVDGADVAFRDVPINTAVDPEQWGNGFVAVDAIVRCQGQVKTPFVRLGVEPLAGATTLILSTAVVGWQAGDRVFLSDTRQVPDTDWFNVNYTLQHETATIASVNGLSVTLTAPLAFSHRGARNADGSLFTLPHVANLTRSIKIRSENPNGTRGHLVFIGRSDVNLSGVEVSDMGRTQAIPLDSTMGTTIGTNQIGRYPVHFHHLNGPVNPSNTGYQYQFTGNVIRDSRKWPLAIHGTHYGLVEGNVIVGGAELTGAGIALEDGSETENMIRGNFVASIRGFVNPAITGPNTANGSCPGCGGEAIWGGGFNNRVINNVVAGSRNASQNVAAGPGFKFVANVGSFVRNPKIRGADLNDATQYTTVQPMRQPLLQFEGNEAYGLMATGITLWYLGTNGYDHPIAPESVVKNFTVWHAYLAAAYLYPTNQLTLDGLKYRVDPAVGAFGGGVAIQSDYRMVNLTVKNSDIHGTAVFGKMPDPLGSFLFDNIHATTKQHAYQFRTPTKAGSQAVRPSSGVTFTIRGGLVLPWPGTGLQTISFFHALANSDTDTTNPYRVTVENYQGLGAAFGAYFPIQATQNLYGGLAPAGADSTTHPEIAGLTFGGPPPPPPVNCAGTWSAWVEVSRTATEITEQRIFSVTTPPANGGTACPASPETRIVPIVPPVNPCVATPLVVTVTKWPTHQTGESTSGAWIPGSFVLVKAGFEWLPTLRFVATDTRGCLFLKVK